MRKTRPHTSAKRKEYGSKKGKRLRRGEQLQLRAEPTSWHHQDYTRVRRFWLPLRIWKRPKKNGPILKTKVDDKHCCIDQVLEGTPLPLGRLSKPRWRVWTSDLDAGPLQWLWPNESKDIATSPYVDKVFVHCKLQDTAQQSKKTKQLLAPTHLQQPPRMLRLATARDGPPHPRDRVCCRERSSVDCWGLERAQNR